MQLFSPEKANALIPKVGPLIEELWARRRDLAIKLLENDPALQMARSSRRMAPFQARKQPRRFSELKAEIVRLVNRIEAFGCVVKDIDLGLLDFPAMRKGEPVFLCWKAGEPQINYWHGTNESFVDRKELRELF